MEEEKLHRAGSYLAVIALPLVEKPKPYCLAMVAVGEGFGSHEIMRIQSSVADVFYKSGLRTVNSGGDGDSGLRVLQNSSIYTNKLGCKLEEYLQLPIPVDHWFGSIAKQTMFTIQDPLHCAKKLRNQALLLETRLLRLGVWTKDDSSEISRLAIRWDHVFDLAEKVPHFMFLCSKSAINMVDKQDPSLAGELASHYQLFLDHGYHGMGIYLKGLQLFLEAFLDPYTYPAVRLQKAFYTKTLFVLWDRNSPSQEFISDQCFTDIKCAVDGLFLYLYMLMKQFPNCPIVPQFLGSDINELFFAFARHGMFAGRRTNMEALRLAQALEKRNALSVISKVWKDMGIAHSRGLRVLRNVTYAEEENWTVYHGSDVHLQDLIQAMRQGSKDCIADERDFKLEYLRGGGGGCSPKKNQKKNSRYTKIGKLALVFFCFFFVFFWFFKISKLALVFFGFFWFFWHWFRPKYEIGNCFFLVFFWFFLFFLA